MAAKKLSALSTQPTLADDDLVTGIDTSAATPAAKNVNFSLSALATWILAKTATVTQEQAEAISSPETVNRWWTVQRVAQCAAAVVAANVSGLNNKWNGTRAPLGTDDNTEVGGEYAQGSIWRWALRVWICVDASTNVAVWVELTAAPSLTNPMTTAGDIIVGGTGGAPVRLAKGTDGQAVKMVAGSVAWADDATGMVNPMTTAGDIIVGGTDGAPARLAIGTEGQVPKVVGGAVAWADGGGSFDPAAPGEIGGTTPAKASFTVINTGIGTDIASASSIDLGAATGNFVTVTGTTEITSLGTAPAGVTRRVRFASALTMVHHATSLILPGGATLRMRTGDVAEFVSLGSGNWRMVSRFAMTPPAAPRLELGAVTSSRDLGLSDLGLYIPLDTSSGSVDLTIQPTSTIAYSDGADFWVAKTSASNTARIMQGSGVTITRNNTDGNLTLSSGLVYHIWRRSANNWLVIAVS
jgi:hypothetical protein